MTKKEQIWQKLSNVIDPELGVNVVDLGLIYNLEIKDGGINILMTLTTPFCPLAGFFEKEIVGKIKEIKWVKDVKINFTFDPPWNISKMTNEARMRLGC